MPTLIQLNDAAIAVCKALDDLGVDFGIFGGYAVAILGGPRESKHIDCVVNCNKDWLVQHLSRLPNFQSMGNIRPDIAQFVFGTNGILLEFFPMSIANVRSERVRVAGQSVAISTTKVLDVVFLFKGKLQAAATRSKHSDAADLHWLEGRYNASLKARIAEFNQFYVGLTVARYPHLEYAFAGLGLAVEACKTLVRGWDPNAVQPPLATSHVQRGLTFGLRNEQSQ